MGYGSVGQRGDHATPNPDTYSPYREKLPDAIVVSRIVAYGTWGPKLLSDNIVLTLLPRIFIFPKLELSPDTRIVIFNFTVITVLVGHSRSHPHSSDPYPPYIPTVTGSL